MLNLFINLNLVTYMAIWIYGIYGLWFILFHHFLVEEDFKFSRMGSHFFSVLLMLQCLKNFFCADIPKNFPSKYKKEKINVNTL